MLLLNEKVRIKAIKRKTGETVEGVFHNDGLQSLWFADGKCVSVLDQIVEWEVLES